MAVHLIPSTLQCVVLILQTWGRRVLFKRPSFAVHKPRYGCEQWALSNYDNSSTDFFCTRQPYRKSERGETLICVLCSTYYMHVRRKNNRTLVDKYHYGGRSLHNNVLCSARATWSVESEVHVTIAVPIKRFTVKIRLESDNIIIVFMAIFFGSHKTRTPRVIYIFLQSIIIIVYTIR